MGMISLGLTKWFEKYKNNEILKILMLIPVTMRGLPNSIEELKLGNYTNAIKFELPLHNNIQSGIKSAKNALRDYLNPVFLMAVNNFGKFLEVMPIFIGKYIFFDFYNKVHIVFTNVPFSDVPWHFCNKEVTELGVFANWQIDWNLNFGTITYKKKVKFYIMANSELKMNPQELIDIVVNEISNEIKQNSKID